MTLINQKEVENIGCKTLNFLKTSWKDQQCMYLRGLNHTFYVVSIDLVNNVSNAAQKFFYVEKIRFETLAVKVQAYLKWVDSYLGR